MSFWTRHVHFSEMFADVGVQAEDEFALVFFGEGFWVDVEVGSPAAVHAAF